jgi:hypothetical protein
MFGFNFRQTQHAMRGTKAPRVARTEGRDPSSNGFVGNIDPALSEQLLDVTVAQREAKIDPDRVLNDFGRKAISGIGNGCHPDPVRLISPSCKIGLDVTSPTNVFCRYLEMAKQISVR